MLLNISERVGLRAALPERGNYVTLGVIDELKRKLVFDEDEIERFQIKQTAQNIAWDCKDDDGEKDFDISAVERDLICGALNTLDQQSALLPVQMGIYKKFLIDAKTDG